jgi:hypothetical protein
MKADKNLIYMLAGTTLVVLGGISLYNRYFSAEAKAAIAAKALADAKTSEVVKSGVPYTAKEFWSSLVSGDMITSLASCNMYKSAMATTTNVAKRLATDLQVKFISKTGDWVKVLYTESILGSGVWATDYTYYLYAPNVKFAKS